MSCRNAYLEMTGLVCFSVAFKSPWAAGLFSFPSFPPLPLPSVLPFFSLKKTAIGCFVSQSTVLSAGCAALNWT